MITELTKKEKAMIKVIIKLEGWGAVMTFVAIKLEQWRSQTINGSSAFEELRELHRRDGGIDKVNELFDQLERTELE